MSRLLPLAFLLFWTAKVAAQPPSADLFQAIGNRLGYMQDVALYKAVNFLAIEDVDRERAVLASAVAHAASAGLDPASVESFFKAQIAVAKAIQYRYRAELLSMPELEPPTDLQRVVRPRLLELGGQIIERMAADLTEHGPFHESQFNAFAAAVDVSYVFDRDKRMLFDALLEVRLVEVEDGQSAARAQSALAE